MAPDTNRSDPRAVAFHISNTEPMMNELQRSLEVLSGMDSRVLASANRERSEATPQKRSAAERARVRGVKSTSLRSSGPASLALGSVQDGVSQDDGCQVVRETGAGRSGQSRRSGQWLPGVCVGESFRG